MEKSIIFVIVISFLVTLYIIPFLIRYLRAIGIIVKDMNKKEKPFVPISGGIAVFIGIFMSIMALIFIQTFFYNAPSDFLILFFAVLTSLAVITFVGFIDDMIIDRGKNSSKGLKQWQKPLLTLVAAIPLMVLNAGTKEVGLPLFGVVNFGLFYTFFLIPVGVVGAANMVNMLAGFNGMEAGMGLVYTFMLGLFAYSNDRYIAAVLAFATFAALLAFYIYNKYPAKILPGDSLTYLLGGVIACIAILGNIEKAALISSFPFFVELFLKLTSKLKARSYGYYKDGKIRSFYNRIYSIPHIFLIKGKYTEKQISNYMILIQLFFSSLIWVI